MAGPDHSGDSVFRAGLPGPRPPGLACPSVPADQPRPAQVPPSSSDGGHHDLVGSPVTTPQSALL